MPERPVTPVDCALAVAIPLSRRAFEADLANPGKDFAASFAARFQDRERAANAYEEHLRDVRRGLREVSRRRWPFGGGEGVTLSETLTVPILGQLLRTHHVVTLLTHVVERWTVSPSDVLDPAEILRRTRTGDDMVTGVVRATCPDLATAEGLGATAQRRAVAAAFTRLLRRGLDDEQHAALGMAPHRWSRLDLEEAFEPALLPAPMIELSDGLVPWTTLRDAVPIDHDGVLDLTMCHSVGIAEALDRAGRECLVLANHDPADLDFRVECYRGVVGLLREAPRRYSDAVDQIHDAVVRALCERSRLS